MLCKIGSLRITCDNQTALYMVFNSIFHERTKHMDINHFIHEKLVYGEIAKSFVNANVMLANILTKSLWGPRISYICDKLGELS